MNSRIIITKLRNKANDELNGELYNIVDRFADFGKDALSADQLEQLEALYRRVRKADDARRAERKALLAEKRRQRLALEANN